MNVLIETVAKFRPISDRNANINLAAMHKQLAQTLEKLLFITLRFDSFARSDLQWNDLCKCRNVCGRDGR